MDQGTPANAAENRKDKVKSFISDIADTPAPSKNDTAAAVKSNLGLRSNPERAQLLGGLNNEIPKFKAVKREAMTQHRNTKRRADNRDRNFQYLDHVWGSRHSWAPPAFFYNGEASGENTITPIASLTKLAVSKGIHLGSLWQPGGELHSAALSHPKGILTKAMATKAYNNLKTRVGIPASVFGILKQDADDYSPFEQGTPFKRPKISTIPVTIRHDPDPPASQTKHWSLAVLGPGKHHLRHYDPIVDDDRDSRVRATFDDILGNPHEFTFTRMFSLQLTPQQHDQHSYGLFVLEILEAILSNKRVPTIVFPEVSRAKILRMIDADQQPPRAFGLSEWRPWTSTPQTHSQSPLALPPISKAITTIATPSTAQMTKLVDDWISATPIFNPRERIASLTTEIRELEAQSQILAKRKLLLETFDSALDATNDLMHTVSDFGEPGSIWRPAAEQTRFQKCLDHVTMSHEVGKGKFSDHGDEMRMLQQCILAARKELDKLTAQAGQAEALEGLKIALVGVKEVFQVDE
ncbi:hypothetical protein F53441_7263 [Fusarium austroafricanum]|uniref:Ubiquitin-like protease family profile domain-containing protein n=1 Tax=Fusarium austroafricanum TaxID=2364996 RepID=A0A8H4KHW7_9HYPO|nr:hypothetical protein F53441_7263 [Fusarium austroafricanum]